MKNKISIIIPVYNESAEIEKVLLDIKSYLDDATDIEYEIVCINDGSTDTSKDILDKIDFIKVLNHKINRGYGAALKSGILSAQNDIILIMDSDGQHKAEDIPMILAPLYKGYDMSVGSRKIHNTKKRRVLGKILINKLASLLIKYKIPDINSGFRCFFKDEAKKYLHLCSNRFSFTTSITLAYFQDNKDIIYLPIKVNKRKTGNSQVNYQSGLLALLKVVRSVMTFNPLRVLLPIVFIFMFFSLISLGIDIVNGNLADSTILLSIATILALIFALISDQLSIIRRELWKK